LPIQFNIAGSALLNVSQCKDLGILVDDHLSFNQHIVSIVAKAKQRIYLLFKCFSSRNISLLVNAYSSYILPILDYCSPVWSPYKLSDIDLLESVQRQFTKNLVGLHEIPYAERLKRCRLCGLELRRLHTDLVMCYMILNQLVALDIKDFFDLDQNHRTRGHSLKLKPPKLTLTQTRSNFFAVRITPVWNALPQDAISSPTVKSFRNKIAACDLSKFLNRPVFL
jgi:hypothetical protein